MSQIIKYNFVKVSKYGDKYSFLLAIFNDIYGWCEYESSRMDQKLLENVG